MREDTFLTLKVMLTPLGVRATLFTCSEMSGLLYVQPSKLVGCQGRRITLRHQFSKERTVPSRSLSFCLHAALSFILFYPC